MPRVGYRRKYFDEKWHHEFVLPNPPRKNSTVVWNPKTENWVYFNHKETTILTSFVYEEIRNTIGTKSNIMDWYDDCGHSLHQFPLEAYFWSPLNKPVSTLDINPPPNL